MMKLIKPQHLKFVLTKLRVPCMSIFHVSLYLLLVSNYVKGNIFLTRNSFFLVSMLYWFLSFLLHFKSRLKVLHKEYLKYLNYLLFAIVPLATFYIEEIIYNPDPFLIPFSRVMMNYILYFGIQVSLLLIFGRKDVASSIILFMGWIFGIANYYVMEFKRNPLLPSDLLAYKTAATVADNYTFALADPIVYATLLLMLFLCFVCMFQDEGKKRPFCKLIKWVLSGIFSIGAFIIIVYNIKWSNIFNITLNGWDPQYSYYENGALFTFLMETQELSVTIPSGYFRSEASALLNENGYQADKITGDDKSASPSVIVIMNESFSDLTVLGDFEADDCLVNWNNISDFVLRGNAYASVVGGGTCNSEFEFLTGNSISNISGNGYPYQMYNFDGVFNLASEFSSNGYETIAIHPENKNNWNRAKVYSQFGFNSFLSLPDIEKKEYIRYYISDKSNYDQIISSYESSDNPVFIFNVTMQNHGGYNEDTMPENIGLVNIEKKYRAYKDVITYLTLVKESDKAFLELLEYFSQVEDPVIVCMFGDHQPAVSEEFWEELQYYEDPSLKNTQKRYCVPYIIWSNYDTGIKNEILDTSLNYLGMNVLDIAGIYSPYSQFLIEMQKEIPVINKLGYQTSEGIWNSFDEPNELLDKYRKLQYYMLFDHP